MPNKTHKHIWMPKVPGLFSSSKAVNYLLPFWVSLGVLILLGACTPALLTDSQATTTAIHEPENNVIPTVVATERIATSTPMPVLVTETPLASLLDEPTATPSATFQPSLGTETGSITVTPVAEPAALMPTGQLFVYNPTGILKVAVTDGTSEYLLTAEDDWLDWGARFAQNGKYLTYWVKRVNGTELWFTPLPQWQPERILEIEDVEYDFATPLWSVNDRYLLFNLSVLDTSGPLEDIKTIRTYIMDIETMALVSQPYWEGDCSILATSPRTGQLAFWCPQISEEESSPVFLVLEPEAAPWFTEQVPSPLVDDCLIRLICAWSQDDEWVAYAVEDSPDLLFYASVDDPMPIRLDDGNTDIYTFPAWSPDEQLLYYSGACGDGGFQCPNVISVPDSRLIWRTQNNSNRGEFGNVSVDHVVWSPDSRYIAMPTIETRVIIFDIMAQKEISRFSNVGSAVLDMVWVTD